MKLYRAMFRLLCVVVLAALPAVAQTLYENGPINGEIDAWTINENFWVSDSFTISGSASTVNGLTFGVWLSPGDVLESAQVAVSSNPGPTGTIYFNQFVNFTQSGCFSNNFGFDVCTETGSFDGPTLNTGTYWLTLQNATSSSGDPIYWDENDGAGCHSQGCPSQAPIAPWER